MATMRSFFTVISNVEVHGLMLTGWARDAIGTIPENAANTHPLGLVYLLEHALDGVPDAARAAHLGTDDRPLGAPGRVWRKFGHR
jgi:hypothetical protein